jgi:acetyltransferase-like isoleucine patch superfamily enzyme
VLKWIPKMMNAARYQGRCFALAALLCLIAPLVHAQSRDTVQFGNDIVVHEGEEAHDAVCFGCSIEVDGTLHGDAVAFFGNIRVNGHAEHDTVAFLGNVTLGENASVERDVVVFAGSLHSGAGSTVGNDRVVFPFFLIILPFLMLAGIIMLIAWAIRSLAFRSRQVYPMPPPRY